MSIVKWMLDPAHSELLFKVTHLMVATVTGSFKKFDLLETEAEAFLMAYNLQYSCRIKFY